VLLGKRFIFVVFSGKIKITATNIKQTYKSGVFINERKAVVAASKATKPT
jgi:hypothetical protein